MLHNPHCFHSVPLHTGHIVLSQLALPLILIKPVIPNLGLMLPLLLDTIMPFLHQHFTLPLPLQEIQDITGDIFNILSNKWHNHL